jgi:hypothetical protein
MADWRDPTQYPDPANTSLNRWAWEFLQRNPEFVKNPDAKEWGIKTRLMPGGRGGEAFFGNSPTHFDLAPRYVGQREIGGSWISYNPVRDDRLVLEFDLDAAIEPQLERARTMLNISQHIYRSEQQEFGKRARRRNRSDKFALYLRILDALVVDVTRNEMLDVFSKETPKGIDESTLRANIDAATALRDGGYRDLLKQ